MERKRAIKSNKGITLIILIITIIIMLIVLGVSMETLDEEVIQEAQGTRNDVGDKVSQGQDKINRLVNDLENISESE